MRQPCGGHRERQGDADMFVAVKRLAAKLKTAVEHLPQQLAGMFAETLALRRELRRVDAAVDQVKAEPGLQRLDAAAERGLRRVSFLGGSRKIAGFGHHQKILKPAKLHHAPRFAAGRGRRAAAKPASGQRMTVDANRRWFSIRNVKAHAGKRSGSADRLANASFASPPPAVISATIPIIPRFVI